MRVFVAGGTGVVGAAAGAAARGPATGVSHFAAQSYAGWNGTRKSGRVKTEGDPLDLHAHDCRQGKWR
ncbi:hypothetical protein ACTWPT_46395 [Nonomuraea sp. 3N208]|uniref:hypothetical protein n=1 Tax=Nonomuraea sp. 3N208 TaxID=3457421 RepID=UPI003FD13212